MVEDDKKPDLDDGAADTFDDTDDEIEVEDGDDDAADGEEFEDDAPRLQAEVDKLNDRLLRAVAETENLRRRAAREREDAGKYAISGFARDLLTVGDNLRRALDSLTDEIRADDSLAGLIDGVELTERELLSAFDRHGIRRIEPKGEKFDPNHHQAIFQIETADQPAGTVVEVVQAGYIIADRVLRPAMVGVAKAAPNGDAAADKGGDNDDGHVDTKA